MDKLKQDIDVDKRDQFQYGLTFLTNPAFQSTEKIDETFYCMVDYKFDGDNNLAKDRWVPVTNQDNIIQPYYAGIAKIIPPKSKYPSFLVTGGVYYDGSESEGINQIPETYNFCYKMQFVEDNGVLRLKILSTRKGRAQTIIDEQGQQIEIQKDENLVPAMTYARHNHMLFAIPKPNNKDGDHLYYAIGGQQFTQQVKDDKFEFCQEIHNSCEVLDEKLKTWQLIAPMKFPRSGFSGFVGNGKIYVFGGFTSDNNFLGAQQSEVYDPAINSWKEIKFRWKIGLDSQLLGACCLNISENKILIIGGSNGNTGPVKQICLLDLTKVDESKQIYEPKQLASKVKLNEGRAKMQASIIKQGNSNYVVISGGGIDKISVETYLFKEDIIKEQSIVNLSFINSSSHKINYFLLLVFQKYFDLTGAILSDLTKNYQFSVLKGEDAWIQSSFALPVLSYSDLERQKLF